MKKLSLIVLTLLLLTGLLAPTVSATPIDELTGLAEYVPAEAAFFASLRIDGAYFETLDSLILNAAEKMGAGSTFEGIATQLDRSIQMDTNGEVTLEDVRAWIGETAALAVAPLNPNMLMDGTPAAMLLVSITDRDGAEAFLDLVLAREVENESITKSTIDNGILLYETDEDSEEAYLLSDEVLVIVNQAAMVNQMNIEPEDSLAKAEAFVAAQAALPEDDYNIFAYTNLPVALRPLLPMLQSAITDDIVAQIDFNALVESLGIQAIGATILAERTLTLDFAFLDGESKFLEALQLPALTQVDVEAADPDFARYAPANTMFYIQMTNSGDVSLAALNDLVAISDAALQQYILPLLEQEEPMAAALIGDFSFSSIKTFSELMSEGIFRMSLEDLYGTLNGQVANYMTLIPHATRIIDFEYAQVYENLDAERTAMFIDGVARLLRDFRVDFIHEDGFIQIEIPAMMTNPGFPDDPDSPPQTVINLTSNEDLIVAATPLLLDYAMSPREDNLAAAKTFAFDSAHFLDDATTIWFINMPAIAGLIDEDSPLREMGPESMLAQVESALGIVDSATITANSGEGVQRLRATLTLGE